MLEALAKRWQTAHRMPRTYTCRADDGTIEGLQRVLAGRFVRVEGENVRLDLGGFFRAGGGDREAEFVKFVFDTLGQPAQPASVGERALREELERGLSQLVVAAVGANSKAFLGGALRDLGASNSAWNHRASRDGVRRALDVAHCVVLCLDALPALRGPIRLQNFSARVLGSSKLLRIGTDVHRELGTALLAYDVSTKAWLEEGTILQPDAQTVLDLHGVYHDESAASVLCFGALVYEKHGQRFDHVARHAALGESSRLLLQQLREARFVEPPARRVTIFENLTPYLDYVDACVRHSLGDEIVLCASGQASWAVVSLLESLARFDLSFRYSGDLDRAGVMILRSLQQRSGAPLTPLLMDAATLVRFSGRGQPLPADELRRIAQRIQRDVPGAACAGLLKAMLNERVWVEQEAFHEDCLEEMLQ